jgi:hypothetical protein
MAQGANYNLISPFLMGGVLTGVLQGVNGTASAPSYSYSGAPSTGWYYDSANASLAATVAGVETVQILTGNKVVLGPKTAAGVQLSNSANGTLTLNDGAGGTVGTLASYYVSPNTLVFSGAGSAAAGTYGSVYGGGVLLSLATNGIVAQTWNYNTQASIFTSTIQYKAATASKATSYSVLAADSATVFDNTGAAAGITFTLPAAAVGLTYTFCTHAAQAITITPQAADAIGAKAANTSFVSSAASGAFFTVVSTAANYWAITSNLAFT